jgi:hypothetical protein
MTSRKNKHKKGANDMPVNTSEDPRANLNEAVRKLDDDFNKYYKRSSSLLGLLRLIRMPHQEVRHIWLANYSILKLAVDGLAATTVRNGNEEMKTHALTMAADYLCKAGRTRNLADAWSCANLAAAFLIKGVDDDDLKAASIGLLSCDKALSKTACERLEKIEASQGLDKAKKKRTKQPSERGRLFSELILRSYVWDSPNRRTSLRIRLLLQVGVILLFLLVGVVLSAGYEESIPWYIAMPLLGAFGGSLSANITARKSVVDAVSYRLIVTLLVLRMLLGAAGAFVAYVVFQWPGLFNTGLVDLIKDGKGPVFLALGIASGFSERLFVGALEKISDKLSINSEDSRLETERKENPG